eukprot:TRINITY_DN7791_c0_g1_i1.p1 TRINITY_DN7791_c0_g1~~TRINITY_DN7791_c0_g1_i1.p1  ORF type:complete len:465 (+),score=189.09 TRINITY_DN7791_c0_g1_i1:66-1460(+)
MPKKSKSRSQKSEPDPSTVLGAKKDPKCFVLQMGTVGESIKRLKQDLRRMMEPNTAARLKEARSNVLKDFLVMAGPLGVTHMMVLSSTQFGSYLRVSKTPQGPTMTFKLDTYSLVSDVAASKKRAVSYHANVYIHAPFLILNNFPKDEAGRLMSTLFRNLFPAMNVQTMKLAECRRVVLMTYSNETKMIELRHYEVTGTVQGVDRRFRRLAADRLPKNLGKVNDIADYMMGEGGATSASEGEEDDAENTVELEQKFNGAGNLQGAKTAIRLKEIGPRITMQLIKIQEDFNGGKVLFHEHIHRSPEEIEALDKMMEEKRLEKIRKKNQQLANVEKKKKEKEKEKSNETADDDVAENMEWYEKEVGKKANKEDFENVQVEKVKDYRKFAKKNKNSQVEDQDEHQVEEKEKSGGMKRKQAGAAENSTKFQKTQPKPQKSPQKADPVKEKSKKAPTGKVLRKRAKATK